MKPEVYEGIPWRASVSERQQPSTRGAQRSDADQDRRVIRLHTISKGVSFRTRPRRQSSPVVDTVVVVRVTGIELAQSAWKAEEESMLIMNLPCVKSVLGPFRAHLLA